MIDEVVCGACGHASVDGGWCVRCQRSALPVACACGVPTTRDGWCPRCGATTSADEPHAPTPPRVTGTSGRRLGRSQITFSFRVRVVWTVAVVAAPLVLNGTLLLLLDGQDPFSPTGGIGLTGWVLPVIWWSTITPWALRDLWRDGRAHRRL